MLYTVEYKTGGKWHAGAHVQALDLARAALAAFRKSSPGVEWRLSDYTGDL
jgi:hypothetical protein